MHTIREDNKDNIHKSTAVKFTADYSCEPFSEALSIWIWHDEDKDTVSLLRPEYDQAAIVISQDNILELARLITEMRKSGKE